MRKLLDTIIFVCLAAAFSCAGVYGQSTEAVLTPAAEYAEIPTRAEALARAAMDSSSQASETSGRRPKVQRTPLEEDIHAHEDGGLESIVVRPGPLLSFPSGADTYHSIPAEESTGSYSLSTEIVQSGDFSVQQAEGTYGHYDGEPLVDLRSFLPAPRLQDKQNCVAYAIGYASYSCQVCQERRGEKPSDPQSIFSPSFIYNTLSKNADDGLHVTQAIDFIREFGCATLHTMPIEQQEALLAANTEASLYCAIDHQKATGIKDIRAYLQEGYPVILVIRSDAEFISGKFAEPYNWDKSKVTQKIMPHAVCAVGYDDDRKAVLVMNSYGSDWNEDGFCWVSYDTLQTIPENRGQVPDEDLPFWCVEAHVAIVKEMSPSVGLKYPKFKVDFQLRQGALFNGSLKVTFDPLKFKEWYIDDLTTNQETIFILRRDQSVFGLANRKEFVFDEAHAIWTNLKAGLPSETKFNMIAAADGTPLFAITNKGVLVQLQSANNLWKAVEMPGTDQLTFVDLRDNRNSNVTATTSDGRIFRFGSNAEWRELPTK